MKQERLHVYVTVPVRNDSAELASNVQCLIDQEGVNPNDYSVLYLVSNNKEEARTQSPVYQDNVKSYELLLNFQRNFGQSLTLRIFDFIDVGKAPDQDSVGLARKRLVEEVISIHFKKDNNTAVIATLDADTLVDKDYIYRLRNIFRDPGVSAIVGSINYRNTDEIPYLEYLYFRIYDTATALLKAEPQVSAQSLAFRLKAYQSAGGFHALSGGEDIDLGRRLIEKGGVVFTDEIVTYPRLRYSDRCIGNGKLLFEIHQSLEKHDPVHFLVGEETLTTEQLISKALNGQEFGLDDLSQVVDDISRRKKKRALSFQELNLLFKYRLLRMVEKKFQQRSDINRS